MEQFIPCHRWHSLVLGTSIDFEVYMFFFGANVSFHNLSIAYRIYRLGFVRTNDHIGVEKSCYKDFHEVRLKYSHASKSCLQC